MARPDQLEVIDRGGSVSFHELDPAKGITNIGRHPENDIVIDSPSIAEFYAILDHRQKPYQIMILEQPGQATLGGEPLAINIARDLHNWDTIEIDGHSLVLLQDDGSVPSTATPAPVSVPTAALAPSHAMAPGAAPIPIGLPPALAGARLPMLPADQTDELIVTELSQRDWVIDCEQTATCQATIINGGDIVASFEVGVEGLDPEWVIIAPPVVNLNEGERATVTIGITPPRASGSRAGAHHFVVRMTSSNYPGRVSRRGATLTINPYYEFALGDLSPRQQTVTWRKRTGKATLPILNKGNADSTFMLTGEDDQKGCAFEFETPGAGLSARQVELKLPPEQSLAAPIHITPIHRSLIGLRKHPYSVTITTTLMQGQATPRSVLGTLTSAPLLGPGLLFVILALLALLIVIIFRPYVTQFEGPNGCTDNCAVAGGTGLTLKYMASPFTEVKLDQGIGQLPDTTGTKDVAPIETTSYNLTANNFLSALFPNLWPNNRTVTVNVKPVPPHIDQFNADHLDILKGQTVTLYWKVTGANQLSLISAPGGEQTITPTTSGQISFKLEVTTQYQLIATNHYGTDKRALTVNVSEPTPTPVPPPIIVQFDVQPRVITEGQSVNITWEVLGAPTVNINGIPGADKYPIKGNISQSPKPPEITYQLIASNGQPGPRNEVQSAPMTVKVNPAPPPPLPPDIIFFAPADAEIYRGKTTQLEWQVLTPTTEIKVTGPDIGELTGQPEHGIIDIAPTNTALYVITAFNGTASSTKTAQVKVNDPPPTPTPLPPNPKIDYFQARCANGAEPGTPECTDVTFVAGAGNQLTYKVRAGKPVQLYWKTHNAASATLNGVAVPNVDGSETIFLLNALSQAVQTFVLEASNPGAKVLKVSQSIQINVTVDVPPSPFNVRGVITTTPPLVTIYWDYDSQNESKIVGFRVYRSDVPGPNFQRVADYTDLPPSSRTWPDPTVNPACDKAYYVVAVALDVFGKPTIESPSSNNSWNTLPCQP